MYNHINIHNLILVLDAYIHTYKLYTCFHAYIFTYITKYIQTHIRIHTYVKAYIYT